MSQFVRHARCHPFVPVLDKSVAVLLTVSVLAMSVAVLLSVSVLAMSVAVLLTVSVLAMSVAVLFICFVSFRRLMSEAG